ncbi:pantetheine-phosphate adenylyltransferase [Fusobacterium perfoetens]|uniref:pantetheine-phosphate adenylyltransferase n=1 Tax=Fusobacterium perfoetens TaxID=852 RepID=UPI0015A39DE7|nr:pantetheine-phosphate adenylyltransferase [Fusobacterium perfoetens]MCF2625964.1 pantetheine-phosphate adenylyltransferase [Fusobacterium perfoetens]
MRVGVYAGSFDPITKGHQDIIDRASRLFDKLVILVSNNSEKKYWFTLKEREEMVGKVLEKYDNIVIETYSGLVVNYCEENNINTIVRGIRTVDDCGLELYFASGNMDISEGKVDSIFLPALKEYIYVSSTAAREIARYGGKVTAYVDERIADMVTERGKKYRPE